MLRNDLELASRSLAWFRRGFSTSWWPGFAGWLICLVLSGPVQAAGPVFWDWPGERSFTDLEFSGTALDSLGRLVAGLTVRSVGPEGPEVIWRAVSDGRGGYYLGSGHAGEIFHTDAGGETRLLAKLEATEVFSLLPRTDGTLLAGCGPEGGLFRIDQEGAVTHLGQVPGGYIWAMVAEPGRPEVWVAAGSPAAVYTYHPDRGLTEVRTLPAQNALDIVHAGGREFLIATQGPGLVYRLDADHPERAEVLIQTQQEEARQFLRGPQGEWFLLALNPTAAEVNSFHDRQGNGNGSVAEQTAELMNMLAGEVEPKVARSALYRLAADGQVYPYWSGPSDLMIAAWNPDLGWLAAGPQPEQGGRTTLWQLTPPAGSHVLGSWLGGDILDILILEDKEEQNILVTQAHPGGVALLRRGGSQERVALSPPLGGDLPVTWGRLRWSGLAGEGKLRWSVRGGNRAVPDESWTDWSTSWTQRDHTLDLPVCRFLQWRVTFPEAGGDHGSSWLVTGVSVSAWQENLPPVIAQFSLEEPVEIFLGGLVSHGDNVTQSFSSGLRAEFSKSTQADKRAPNNRAAMTRPIRTFAWGASDPNGDRLQYELGYRPEGAAAWTVFRQESQELVGSWDTSTVQDGVYQVKLTVNDRLDNPAASTQVAYRIMGHIEVDNTPPELSDLSVTLAAGGLAVNFSAEDRASVLAGAGITLPDGSWQRLDPDDLICDSNREVFSAVVQWPPEDSALLRRPWQVRIEVMDLGGNTAFARIEVR